MWDIVQMERSYGAHISCHLKLQAMCARYAYWLPRHVQAPQKDPDRMDCYIESDWKTSKTISTYGLQMRMADVIQEIQLRSLSEHIIGLCTIQQECRHFLVLTATIHLLTLFTSPPTPTSSLPNTCLLPPPPL
jgi:hypothetical protein